MQFVAIEMKFNPETGFGSVTALEAIEFDGELRAEGSVQFTVPLSDDACNKISEILAEEVIAAPAKMAST